MIYTAGLKAVKFTGDFKKRLFEIGGRQNIVLNQDDIVIVNEVQFVLLVRQRYFEPVDINSIIVKENVKTKTNKKDTTSVSSS